MWEPNSIGDSTPSPTPIWTAGGFTGRAAGCWAVQFDQRPHRRARSAERLRPVGEPRQSGLGLERVLPYFIKLKATSSATTRFTAAAARSASAHRQAARTHRGLDRGGERCGVPRTADFNGARQEGVGYYQLTTHNGWRGQSAADAYLRPARRTAQTTSRSSPMRRLRAFCSISRRATRRDLPHRRAVARSARHGTASCWRPAPIQSPQLLMLSGIGPGPRCARTTSR